MKVLIADDSPSILSILTKVLGSVNYEVVAAKDGDQAWKALEEDPSIQLAILDWIMPGMTGVEICRRLQEEDPHRFVYIILLTSLDGTEKMVQALESGASDFIRKPFERNDLLARLSAGRRIIQLQSQLLDAQRFKSIGQLTAGIAHEMNTPIQYIESNLMFVEKSIQALLHLAIMESSLLMEDSSGGADAALSCQIQRMREELDIEFLCTEVPRAIQESLEGSRRIARIIVALRNLSGSQMEAKSRADVNGIVQTALVVCGNEIEEDAVVETSLAPGLPPISCAPSELSQALLSLLLNAVAAIREKRSAGVEARGRISILTAKTPGGIEIRITDDGVGIPASIRDRVFEPFFTTRPAGKGAGLGLALAHSVIVGGHGGSISFESVDGRGTCFIVRLPDPEGGD